MEFLQELFALIGRVLISITFLWSAILKMKHWEPTLEHMRSKHIPKPQVILPIGLALQILGSLSIILGWHARLGSILLLIVALASLFYMHSWWKRHGAERETEKFCCLKDLAVIGGLFMILAFGAGHWIL